MITITGLSLTKFNFGLISGLLEEAQVDGGRGIDIARAYSNTNTAALNTYSRTFSNIGMLENS